MLGLVQYSTYRERDYDAIWDRYAWVRPLTIWFERVRGKRKGIHKVLQPAKLAKLQNTDEQIRRNQILKSAKLTHK